MPIQSHLVLCVEGPPILWVFHFWGSYTVTCALIIMFHLLVLVLDHSSLAEWWRQRLGIKKGKQFYLQSAGRKAVFKVLDGEKKFAINNLMYGCLAGRVGEMTSKDSKRLMETWSRKGEPCWREWQVGGARWFWSRLMFGWSHNEWGGFQETWRSKKFQRLV